MTSEVAPEASAFGKYRLLRKLAQGGMAEIFLAVQTGIQGFEKVVVVKRVLPDLSASDEFVNMFLDEARIAARLDHPNIVHIYELGEVNGQYYIAMEYIAGEDLASVIQQARRLKQYVPIEVAVDAVLGAAEGLLFAHELEDDDGKLLNLVHRDVSPSNILLSYQGVVKIVDFGIARAESNVSKTQGGQLKGKINYLSPEQCRGEMVDRRSDIFALGIVLHELLTLRRLFQRDTQLAAMNAILSEKIPPPSQFRPDIPPELDAIIAKALERDVSLRYQTAGELAADLGVFLVQRDYARTGKFVEYLTHAFGEDRKKAKLRVAKGGIKLDELSRQQGGGSGATKSGSYPSVTPSRRTPSSGSMPRANTSDLIPIRTGDTGVPAPHSSPSGVNVRPPSGSGPFPKPPTQPSGVMPGMATPKPMSVEETEAKTSVADSGLIQREALLAQQKKRRPLIFGAIGAVVVLGVFAAALAFSNKGEEKPAKNVVLPEMKVDVTVPGGDKQPGKQPDKQPDKVAEKEPDKTAANPGLQVGGVRFEGAPGGSHITLDGNAVANPSADSFVAAGKHQVRVEANGFLPFEQSVEIKVGEVVKVPVVLKPRPREAIGFIDIACQPWCMISIDNRDTGKTSPAKIAVAPGTHTLLLSNAPAGLAKKVTVQVAENAVVKKVIKLDE